MINRDKVRGFFIGTAIGDSLGMPVETWTPEQIRQKYPDGLRKYEVPDGHKWFNGQAAGTWTDDTMFTLATAKAFIEARGFSHNALVRSQIWAMEEALKTIKPGDVIGGSGIPGWGKTTADAIRRLANNVPYNLSGRTTDPNAGHGNGVVMKVGPIAAWLAAQPYNRRFSNDQDIVEFSAMTHYTRQSAIAAVTHVQVLVDCFLKTPETYILTQHFFEHFQETSDFSVEFLKETNKDMWAELAKVRESVNEPAEALGELFGCGSCNAAHSLPFTYAHWARDRSIEVLYRVAEAGGDTDSNASIVGGMLGALHGVEYFPEHLLTELDRYGDIEDTAEQFCNTFGIQ